MASFSGFSKSFVAFFIGLKKNNSKSYFDAKHEIYENVVKLEMEAFILAVGEGLKKISSYFMVDPRVGGSMYRLNRDIRFSANKMPYKTHCAALFYHQQGGRHELPAFYFQIDPDTVMFAAGHYMVSPEHLDLVRRAIDRNGSLLTTILKRPAFKKRFGQIQGEALKKPPRGYDADHPHVELLKLKQYLLDEEEPVKKWIDDPRLVKRTLESFRASAPLVRFLCTALNVPF
ncbi:MAG: DUF2461 domain-containing protein [bacterium]